MQVNLVSTRTTANSPSFAATLQETRALKKCIRFFKRNLASSLIITKFDELDKQLPKNTTLVIDGFSRSLFTGIYRITGSITNGADTKYFERKFATPASGLVALVTGAKNTARYLQEPTMQMADKVTKMLQRIKV